MKDLEFLLVLEIGLIYVFGPGREFLVFVIFFHDK
jgi:hypothetical protein